MAVTRDIAQKEMRNKLHDATPTPTVDYARSEAGAMRESIGTKIDTTLVPYELVLQAAIGLNYGAEKYEERNFEKGFSIEQLCGSIERHNKAIMDGEYRDRSSGLPHLALLASSIAMLCHNAMQDRLSSSHSSKNGYSIDIISQAAQRELENRTPTA